MQKTTIDGSDTVLEFTIDLSG